jgi:predicted Zn-dependent peptidase
MENIEYYSLSDTFKAVLLPLPIHTVSIGIAVPIGAMHETKDQFGIAHLLEHMLFAGTQTRTSDDIDKLIESYGSSINAYTNYTETVYEAYGNGNHAMKLLDVIMDIFLNSTYPKEVVEREKNVVVQELRPIYENNPGMKRYLTAIDLLFKGINERLRHHVAGYERNIVKYSRKDIIDFHSTHYKETFLIISGKFDKEATINYLEKNLNSKAVKWHRNIIKPKENLVIPFYGNLNKVIKFSNKKKQAYVDFYFRTIDEHSKWITHMGIISYILTGNLNSMLSKVLRKELGAVYSVDSSSKLYNNCGYFTISFSCNKAMVDTCVDTVWRVLEELKKGNIDKNYLEVVKNLRETRNYFIFDCYENYHKIVVDSIINNIDIPNPKTIIDKINKVTIEELKELSSKIFNDDNCLIIIEG